MAFFDTYLGEIAGLSTAVLWAFGGLLFASAGRRIGSAAVNEIRLLLSVAILILAHWALRGAPWPNGIRDDQLFFLALSGLAGLTLGDMFYFHCIVILGPRLGSLLMATAPAMTVALAWVFLGEALGLLQLVGIGITTIGIWAVLTDPRGRAEWVTDHPPAAKRLALVTGLLGALGQAAGNVLNKRGMIDTVDPAASVDPLSAVVVRMAAGTVGIAVIAVLAGHAVRTARAVRDRPAMSRVLLAVCIGPTFGVWLFQVSLRHTYAGVAAILVSLVPILMIPIARVAYGARPSRIAILGTIVAVLGTAMLFLP